MCWSSDFKRERLSVRGLARRSAAGEGKGAVDVWHYVERGHY